MKVKKNLKLIVVAILMIIFFILVYLFKSNKIQPFDNMIYNFVKGIQNETLTSIFKVITEFGGITSVFFITVITVLVLCFANKRKIALWVSMNIIISSLIYSIFKNSIQRPRPPEAERLIIESGFSFPSGHTTNNIAFYGLAIYLIYKNVTNKKIRNTLCVILGIIPILIAFSRIYLRVHYPSDVVAGICLGISIVILFINNIIKNGEVYEEKRCKR